MKSEFRELEAVESMTKFVRVLRENAGLSIKPVSAHIRIAYDTYMNLQDNILTLEYIGYTNPISTIVSRTFKTSKYMTDAEVERHVKKLIDYVGISPTH